MESFSEEEKKCKDQALRFLAVRSLSSCELKQKLLRKGMAPAIIEKAIAACQRLGYLNDEEEINRFIERQQSQGYGPQLISLKLKARGWKEEDPLFRSAMIRVKKEETETLRRYLAKKPPKKELRKVVSSLQRRGFSFSSINLCINTSSFITEEICTLEF